MYIKQQQISEIVIVKTHTGKERLPVAAKGAAVWYTSLCILLKKCAKYLDMCDICVNTHILPAR